MTGGLPRPSFKAIGIYYLLLQLTSILWKLLALKPIEISSTVCLDCTFTGKAIAVIEQITVLVICFVSI